MKLSKLTMAVLLSAISMQNAFSQFTINAEIRPRGEYRNGYKQLYSTNPDPAFFVSQRTRLTLDYTNDKVITKISFQDVRVWGDEKFKTDVATLGLKEAWVDFKLCDSIWLKIGRQVFAFDNERLMGSVNWNQVGMSHDAILLHAKNKTWSLDAGGAFNQISDATLWGTDYALLSPTNYKALGFIWLTRHFKNLDLTATCITDGYQKTTTKNTTYARVTSGISANYKTEKLKFSGRGYWQSGKNILGVKINAWFANADVKYNISKKLSFLLGFEHWSGQHSNANNNDNRFDVLYGGAHRFNGNMDFYKTKDDVLGMGLNDYYANVSYKINKKLLLKTDIHYLNSDKDFFYKNGVRYHFAKNLGTEADLSFSWDLYEYVNINAGYSFMLPSKPFADAQFTMTGVQYNTKRIPQWAFVMLTFNMDLFTSASSKK